MTRIKSSLGKLYNDVHYAFLNLKDNTLAKHYYYMRSNAEKYRIEDDIEKRICVFAPHIDDEILGLGGILKKYTKLGIMVKIIYVTDGRKSIAPEMNEEEMRTARIKEGKMVEERLRISNSEYLDLKSMEYTQKDIDQVIDETLEKYSPDIVYFPNLVDVNLDHVMLAKSMLTTAHSSQLRMYSVQTPLPISLCTKLVEIDNEIKDKIDMISIFESQMLMHKSFERVVLYNKLIGKKINAEYAETFLIISDEYRKRLLNHKPKQTKVKRISSYEGIYHALKHSDGYW